jgi:hypothetical protein
MWNHHEGKYEKYLHPTPEESNRRAEKHSQRISAYIFEDDGIRYSITITSRYSLLMIKPMPMALKFLYVQFVRARFKARA